MVTVGVCQYDLRHHDLPDDEELVPVGGGAGREFTAFHLPGLCDALGGGEDLAPAVAGVQGVHGLVELRGTGGLGVVFFGLERAGAPRQGDLFAAAEPTRPSKLYKAVDALNARYGRGKVFSAAEGIAKPWKMKRGKLSPRATTNWNELLVVG